MLQNIIISQYNDPFGDRPLWVPAEAMGWTWN